jgi:phosphoglycolate phosphatase
MRILLFDIDGTLLLTGGVGTRSFAKAFQDNYGQPPDMSCYSPWGATDFQIGRSLLEFHFPEKVIEHAEVQALLDRYLDCFGNALGGDENFRLLPAALACIERFAEQPDTLVGVATGNLSRAAWWKLEKAGLHHWIRFGGFAEDGIARADILRAAQQRAMAIAAQENAGGNHTYWVIGDTPKDILAAREIGVRVAAVGTGKFTLAELQPYAPDLLLEDLSSLAAQPHLLDSVER